MFPIKINRFPVPLYKAYYIPLSRGTEEKM